MCGIVGIVQSHPVDVQQVARMGDLIRHRGPDDEGIVVFPAQGAVCLSGDDTPSFDGVESLPYRPIAHRRDWLGEHPPTFLAMGHRRLSIVDLSPLGHQPMNSAVVASPAINGLIPSSPRRSWSSDWKACSARFLATPTRSRSRSRCGSTN